MWYAVMLPPTMVNSRLAGLAYRVSNSSLNRDIVCPAARGDLLHPVRRYSSTAKHYAQNKVHLLQTLDLAALPNLAPSCPE